MVASSSGRWACASDADLPTVHALQDATMLTPLDPPPYRPVWPSPDLDGARRPRLLGEAAGLVPAVPPADRDQPLQRGSLARFTATETRRTLAAEDDRRRACRAGRGTRRTSLHQALTAGGSSPEVNGWKLTFHVFDYNLDFFEVGALDDDRFKIADPSRGSSNGRPRRSADCGGTTPTRPPTS